MENNQDEIQLKDILIKLSEYKVALWKKKWQIILFSFLMSVLGILFAFLSPIRYTANLTFVVEDAQKSNPLGAISGIASQFGVDVGGSSNSTFSQPNIMQLLLSRSVVEAALLKKVSIGEDKDLMVEHYISLYKWREKWEKSNDFKGVNFNNEHTFYHDSIMGGIFQKMIENDLKIEIENEDASIITLSFSSPDAEFSKRFSEILMDEMSRMYIRYQTEQARNTLDFLQERADSVFSALQQTEAEYARVKDINQRIIKVSGRLRELQLMRDVEVLNTMYLEIVKNLELSKITLLNQTPIINIIDRPILPLEEDKISKTIGAILGGFLGGFLTFCFIVMQKLFKDALAEH